MQAGTICFFWGYRSIHTNEPCDPAKLRATALFHYGDPHLGSRARALIRRIREIEDRWKSAFKRTLRSTYLAIRWCPATFTAHRVGPRREVAKSWVSGLVLS